MRRRAIPVVLVDGMNLAYRSHYAYHELRDSSKRSTGLLYGFLRAMLDLQTRYSSRIIVCWDCPKGWRRKVSHEYKSNRKTANDADVVIVHQQLRILRPFLSTVLGYLCLSSPGLEADDLMSLLANTFTGEEQVPVFLFTGDRDMYQVLSCPKSTVIRSSNGKLTEVTSSDVLAEYQIPCRLWSHYLAAGGDQSDGLHAFPRIGPKTSLALVKAGLRANAPFEAQPEEVKQQLQKFLPQWNRLQEIWKLVRLPRSASSRFIPQVHRVDAARVIESARNYQRKLKPNALDKFTAFCADYEMQVLMLKRHQFFQWADPSQSNST